MADSNVLLVWTENPANLLMGTNGPGADSVLWAEWSPTNRAWTAPELLAGGLAYRLSQSLAGASNTAVYAWTTDSDGQLTNDADQEVFYCAFSNGTWSAVNQFTTNGMPDKDVRVAISSGGEPCLLWESGTNLLIKEGKAILTESVEDILAELAPRLDRKRLPHPLKTHRDLFQVAQPLDIPLQRLAPGAKDWNPAAFSPVTGLIYIPHTTAGITVNEGADPAVQRDIAFFLNKLVPQDPYFTHSEGNSDAHIKSTLVGTSQTLLIDNGKLLLGTWQSVYFCEFDGPRQRRIAVKIIADE